MATLRTLSLSILPTAIVVIVINHISVIVVAVHLSVSLLISPSFLSKPIQSSQITSHLEPGSAQGPFLLKGSFSLRSHEVLVHGGMLGPCNFKSIF